MSRTCLGEMIVIVNKQLCSGQNRNSVCMSATPSCPFRKFGGPQNEGVGVRTPYPHPLIRPRSGNGQSGLRGVGIVRGISVQLGNTQFVF